MRKRNTMKRYRAIWMMLGLLGCSVLGSGCGCSPDGISGVTVKTKYQSLYGTKKVRIAFVATGCLLSDLIPRICHLEKHLAPGDEYIHEFLEMHTNRGLFIACSPATLFPSKEDFLSKNAMVIKTQNNWAHTITIESNKQVKVETQDNFGNIVEKYSKTLTACKL